MMEHQTFEASKTRDNLKSRDKTKKTHHKILFGYLWDAASDLEFGVYSARKFVEEEFTKVYPIEELLEQARGLDTHAYQADDFLSALVYYTTAVGNRLPHLREQWGLVPLGPVSAPIYLIPGQVVDAATLPGNVWSDARAPRMTEAGLLSVPVNWPFGGLATHRFDIDPLYGHTRDMCQALLEHGLADSVWFRSGAGAFEMGASAYKGSGSLEVRFPGDARGVFLEGAFPEG